MVTSTPVVMMTQHVAADVSSPTTTAAPSNNEHLSVTGGGGHTTNTGHHMAANSNSPCGSSSATVVFSPAKLREDEKRIQMVRSIVCVCVDKYIYFSQVVPKMTSSILKKIARLCTPHRNDDLNK